MKCSLCTGWSWRERGPAHSSEAWDQTSSVWHLPGIFFSTLAETQIPVSHSRTPIFSSQLDQQWSDNRTARHVDAFEERCAFFFFYPHGFHLGAALMLLLSPAWLLSIRSHFYNLAESYISTQTSGCMQLSVTHHVTLVVSCYNGGVVILSLVRLCSCRCVDVIVVADLSAAASHEHDCPPHVDFFHFLSVHRGRPLYPRERFTYSVSCAVLFLTSLGCLLLFGSDCVCVWVHVSCRLVAQLWKHQSVLSPWQLEDTQL